jgi:oligoendopeptidase F
MTEIKNNALPKREEIDIKYKWKLEDIYANNELWEDDFKKIRLLSSDIAVFKGSLEKSPETLLKCLKLCDDMLSLNDKLFVYARMRRDENNADSVYQALTDRAMALSTEVYAAVSFIVPEVISIDEKVLKEYIDSNTELQLYKQYFAEILRQKRHILSEREEELLAFSAELAHAPADIFLMFNKDRKSVV